MISALDIVYPQIKSLGLTVRSHKIVVKDNKKCHYYFDKLYDHNRHLIKYHSVLNKYHNAIHVFTGELHGGYIGIDIDNKNNKDSYTGFCNAVGTVPATLACTTPNNGYHYVFKLSQSQQTALAKYKTGQPKLFGYDIDVLYNTGRFVMSGSYTIEETNFEYKIIDYSVPAILPDIIFDEIMKCCSTSYQISDNFNSQIKINMYSHIDLILKLYLDCLKNDRCNEYYQWLKIGAIIFNEGGSFELFNWWSSSSVKYNSHECTRLWKSFNIDHPYKLTLANLQEYAKTDNPNLYQLAKNKIKTLPHSPKIIKQQPTKLSKLEIII